MALLPEKSEIFENITHIIWARCIKICFISFAVGGVVAMLCERKLHRIVDQVGGRLPMNRYRIAGFFFTLSALFFVLSVIFCFR